MAQPNQPEPRKPIPFDAALRRILQSPPKHKKSKPAGKAKPAKTKSQ